MSTSIHANIEYRHRNSPMWMTYGDVNPGVSFSNIFGLLGARFHDEAKAIVPARGWPKGDVGYGFRRQAAGLVVKGQLQDERESDGNVLTEATADEWLRLGSTWLEDEWQGEYRYISDPDIHSVNWITSDELAAVIRAARKPGTFLAGYEAALAAMQALEASPEVESVRFIYGFDN